MNAVKDVARALEQRMKEYGTFIVPKLELTPRWLEQVNWVAQEATRMRRIVEEVRRTGERARDMLLEIGWPPPWHLPAATMDEIVRSYHGGALTAEDVVDIVLELYDRGTLDYLVKEWETIGWLTPRMAAIREGIASYQDGRFFAAVCTLLPHIEGVLGDELKRKPNPQNDAEKIFRHTGMSEAAKQFYIKVARADFWFDPARPVPEMSRNAILHGRDLSYGTKAHALRTLLVLDTVIGAVNDRRREREVEQRGAEEVDDPGLG